MNTTAGSKVNPRSMYYSVDEFLLYYLLSVGIELGKSVEQAGPSLTFNPEGACRWLFCHIREAREPLARYFLLKPSFLYRPKKALER